MTAVEAPTARAEDQRVVLHEVDWAGYETLLAIRGDRAGPRIAYLQGELELMSPSHSHEKIKKRIARLLEAWADERGLELEGYGSWTVRKAAKARGLEPDECYVLGSHEPERPDLAIEVIWTSGGIDKLEIYRGLGVPEVWVWREGQIQVWVLRGDAYVPAPRSALLPELDLARLAGFVSAGSQSQAVRAWRESLRRP